MHLQITIAIAVALLAAAIPVTAFQWDIRALTARKRAGFIISASVDVAYIRSPENQAQFPVHHAPMPYMSSTTTTSSATTLPKPKMRYSSSDWILNLRTLRSSMILRQIQHHLAATTLVAVLVALLRFAEILPRNHAVLEGSPHSLLGGALSLLLVFRTNAAYDRWWEARKTCGSILAISRDAARYCGQFVSVHEHRVRIASLLAVFPELLRLQVTNRPRAAHTAAAKTACIAAGVAVNDIDRIVDAQHRALECTRVLGAAVKQAFDDECDSGDSGISDTEKKTNLQSVSLHASLQRAVERQLLEDQIQSLSRCLGVCERIRMAPVPYSYSRHTSRLLTMFIGTLSFVLPAPPLALPFIVAFVAWALLSIEKIGHIIEEPFNVPFSSTPEHPRTSLNMEGIADSVVDDVVSAVPELMAVKCNRSQVDEVCETL